MAIGLLENVVAERADAARVQRAAGRGRVAGDGCALAAVGRERSSGRTSPSRVLGSGVENGCVDAEDGCDGAGDGCFFAADMQKNACAVRVETNARGRLDHHGRLFAIVVGELSATGGDFVCDGCFDAHVGCALAGGAGRNAADAYEESAVDRRDSTVARKYPACGFPVAASGCAVPADG